MVSCIKINEIISMIENNLPNKIANLIKEKNNILKQVSEITNIEIEKLKKILKDSYIEESSEPISYMKSYIFKKYDFRENAINGILIISIKRLYEITDKFIEINNILE